MQMKEHPKFWSQIKINPVLQGIVLTGQNPISKQDLESMKSESFRQQS